MTTITFRAGVLASDSQVTVDSDAGGSRKFACQKLYRKITKDGEEVVIATSGDSTESLLFVDWYGSGRKRRPRALIDAGADFACLVLRADGRLFQYDAWCRPEEITPDLHPHGYAIGSGAKAALGALHMGATAEQACEIACRIDTYSAPPVVVMRL